MADALSYRIIPKRDIPAPYHRKHRHYGEWRALVRHLRLLDTSQALEIELDGMDHRTAVSSLHYAARASGVRISSASVGTSIFVVRVGMEEIPAPEIRDIIRCEGCGNDLVAYRRRQRYCAAEECQYKRKAANWAAYELRRAKR